MKNILYAFIALLIFSAAGQAQEKYIGLNSMELGVLSQFARVQNDKAEQERIEGYKNFLAKIDTLYEVFSAKLNEDGLSPSYKGLLNSRLRTIDELHYYASSFREALIEGRNIEAQESLQAYYKALELLELKEYFLSLSIEGTNTLNKESSIESVASITYSPESGSLNYYLGFKLNYSIVSFRSEQMQDPLGSTVATDDGIGGVSSNLYFGLSYQINPKFSAFAELGLSGQDLSYSSEMTFTDGVDPNVSFFFKNTRDFRQSFTDFKLGGTYHYMKLQAHLALQFSFMNSLELIETYEDSFLTESVITNRTEEEVIDINKTRTFLFFGASYPVYQFYLFDRNISLDALADFTFGLSSVYDDQIQGGYFFNVEKLNNSMINLGLRLRL